MAKRERRIEAKDLLENPLLTDEARARLKRSLIEQGAMEDDSVRKVEGELVPYPKMTSLGLTESELNAGCYRMLGYGLAGLIAFVFGIIILFGTLGLIARKMQPEAEYNPHPKPVPQRVERKLR